MGRPKGKTSGYTFRTKEEKFKIIEPVLNYEISGQQLSKQTGISNGVINNWIHLYEKGGIEALENKRKPGNPITALYTSKKLSKEQKLELENLRLRIENERLKKGYTTKEADRIKKQFKKNMK